MPPLRFPFPIPVVRFNSQGALEESTYEPRIHGETQLAMMSLDVAEAMLQSMQDVAEALKATQPQGVVKDKPFSVEGREIQELTDTDNKWFGITVRNDGPDTIFIYINRRNHPEPTRVRINDPVNIQFNTAVIGKLYVSCDVAGNSASGRIAVQY